MHDEMLYAKRKKIKENLENLKKSNPNPPVVSQHLVSWQEEMAVEREMGREEDTSVGGCENNVQCGKEDTSEGGGEEQCGKEDTSEGGEQVSTPTCTD